MAQTPAFDLRKTAYAECVRLFRAGQVDAALDKALKLLKAYPKAHEIYEIAALCYARKRQFKPALAAFEAIERLGKANRTVHANMAKANYELGRYAACEAILRRMDKAARGKDAAVSVLLGDVSRKQGRLQDSLDHYRRAIETPRTAAEARRGMATVLKALMRPDDALEIDRAAIAEAPRGPRGARTLLNYDPGQITAEDLALAERLLVSPDPVAIAPSERRHLEGLIDLHKGDIPAYAAKIREANALKLAELGTDPSERPYYDRLGPQIDAMTPAAEPDDPDAPRLLLILGPSTSGKSTLEAMLAGSPVAVPRYEGFDKEAVRRFETGEETPKSGEAALRALFFVGPEEPDIAGKVVIGTIPSALFRLPLIARLVPGLRVVSILKDTLPLTVDILTKYYTNGNAYSYDIAATREYIALYRDAMARMGAILGDRFLEIPQARIATDPAGTLARVEALLGRDLGLDPGAIRPRIDSRPEGYHDTLADLLGVPRD